jgi:hypothetical protein
MNLIEIRQKTEVYSGDVKTIVSSKIESAMVAFGRNLKEVEGTPLPRTSLDPIALLVKGECNSYLQ